MGRKKRRSRSIKVSTSPLLWIVALLAASGIFYGTKALLHSEIQLWPQTPSKTATIGHHGADLHVTRSRIERKFSDVYNRKLMTSGTSESKFGVGTLAPKVAGGRMTIPFVFKAEKKWCTPGDLDTIVKTVRNRNSRELLVTLENISDKAVYGKFRMSVNELLKGNNRAFVTAASMGTESLGLFICRDINRTGSCLSKDIVSQDEITRQFAANQAASAKRDYVYYFQNVLMSKGKLQIYRNANAEISMASGLQNFLESTYNLKEADFQRATELNSTIRSVPAMIIDKRILLTLPYNDPSCVASSEPPDPRHPTRN